MARLLTRLGLSLLGLLLAFLVAEVGLRVAGLSYFRAPLADETLGVSHPPRASGWFVSEGRDYIVLNGEGLRDRDHAVAKPANTLRIAVLGDSYSEALQLPMDQAYWSVLGRTLPSCPALNGRQVEVMNFGIGGYGTTQELLMLRDRAWKYAPDVVLLEFYGNDVEDNSRELTADKLRPFYVHRDGQLVLDTSFRDLPSFRLAESPPGRVVFGAILPNSAVLKLAFQARFVSKVRSLTPDVFAAGGVPPEVFAEPTDPRWREAWSITEDVVGMTAAEVRGHGARLFLANVSIPIQAHPNLAERADFATALGVPDLFYPNRRVQSVAEHDSIPFVDLGAPMAEYAAQNHVPVHGYDGQTTGHWNQLGHRLAGELIAQRLCGELSRS